MKKIQAILIFTLISSASLAFETNPTCSVNDDCPDLYDCIENVCVHKPLFPITAREVLGTFFILLLNSIMTAGGVGAGAAYVPYIMLLFQKNLKQSIFIGYACVFGGGMGNLANIITLKNLKTNRYLINYDVNLIILPALMIGVLIGVLLNRMVPPFVTNIILSMVLLFSIYKNFSKLRVNLAKERKQKAQKVQENKENQAKVEEIIVRVEIEENKTIQNNQNMEKSENIQVGSLENVASTVNTFSKIESSTTNDLPKEDNDSPSDTRSESSSQTTEKRERILKNEQRFPFHKIRELLINVVIIVVIGLIRGSKTFVPVVGVEWTCGWDFIWFGIAIFAFLIVLIRCVYLTQKWQNEKLEAGYEFLPEEPLLTRSRTIKLIIGSTAAGIVGALVALGGAMIIGPILLDMNMPPAFSAATTGVFMIFSMFNAMYQTILNGNLKWQELAWFLPLSFIFSYASSKLVNWYVKKTGKQSTVILLVISGAIMGFLCLLAVFIKGMVEDFNAQVHFTPIC